MGVVRDLWQKPSFRAMFFGILIIANVVLLAVYYRGSKHTRSEMYSGSVAERIELWDRQKRLNLSRDSVSAFVKKVLMNQELSIPNGVSAYPMESITEEQRIDLEQAFVNFIEAYASDNPRIIFQYLVSDRGLGEVVLTDAVKSLKAELLRKNPSVVIDSEEDFFVCLWKESNFNFHWHFLLEESGKFCLWETTVRGVATNNEIHTMGLEEEGLFYNKSLSPHVFVEKSSTSTSVPGSRVSMDKKLVFADFYFVMELSEEKGREFCAVKTRFVLDGNDKWSPFMLAWALSSPEPILGGVMF